MLPDPALCLKRHSAVAMVVFTLARAQQVHAGCVFSGTRCSQCIHQNILLHSCEHAKKQETLAAVGEHTEQATLFVTEYVLSVPLVRCGCL